MAAEMSRESRAMLLNVLWHHQGGSSPVGQPLRKLLGIEQHDYLTVEQLSEAKWIDKLLAVHKTPARVAIPDAPHPYQRAALDALASPEPVSVRIAGVPAASYPLRVGTVPATGDRKAYTTPGVPASCPNCAGWKLLAESALAAAESGERIEAIRAKYGLGTPGVAPSDATDEDELAPEHLRMADALDEIAKPLARGSASIVRRAAEMLRTRGVQEGGK